LIRLEVAASLTRPVRAEKQQERLSVPEAVSRYGKWFRLLERPVISLVPESQLLQEAVHLSAEIRHTLQDCMYRAAARHLDAPLLTADRPFQERAVRFYDRSSLLSGCEANRE